MGVLFMGIPRHGCDCEDGGVEKKHSGNFHSFLREETGAMPSPAGRLDVQFGKPNGCGIDWIWSDTVELR